MVPGERGKQRELGLKADCRVRPKAWVGAKDQGEIGRTGQERQLKSLFAFRSSLYASATVSGRESQTAEVDVLLMETEDSELSSGDSSCSLNHILRQTLGPAFGQPTRLQETLARPFQHFSDIRPF